MKYICALIFILLPAIAFTQVLHFRYLDTAEVALNRGDYKNYRIWMDKAAKEYGTNPGGCGNGLYAYEVSVKKLRAIYYSKTGNTDDAIQILLPLALNQGLIGENRDIINTLKTILLQKYTAEQIRKEVINAVDNMSPSLTDTTNFSIDIFGTKQIIHTIDIYTFMYKKYGIAYKDMTYEMRDSINYGYYDVTVKDAAPYMVSNYKETYFYKTMTGHN